MDYTEIGLQYCRQVVNGEIVACQWIVMACRRHLRDLETPPPSVNQLNQVDGHCWFDRKAANRVCKFTELLPHIKGRWRSPTITLEPWQCFILTSLFGWKNAAGFRRFRLALILIPRKNAKTTTAAAIAMYLAAVDEEPGAEVYSAARSRSQARVVWELAQQMIDSRFCRGFRKRYSIKTHAHHISFAANNAVFRPISRDAKALEGAHPHGWVADELHAHKDRSVFDALVQGSGARTQPLGVMISTEGDSTSGILAEQVHYAQQVLSGRHEDHTYFAVLYTMDKGDDWTAPATWYKTNPNLGVSVSVAELAQLCKQAQISTSAQATFLSRRMNVRVGSMNAFFNMLAWSNLCKEPGLRLADFAGQPCFIGVDLATKKDLVAVVKGFKRGEHFCVFPRFYLPSDALNEGNPNYDFYRGWAAKTDGSGLPLLTLCDGPKIRQSQVEEDLMNDADLYDVVSIGVDTWQGDRLMENLQDAGLPAVEVPQRTVRLSAPMKELDADILAGNLRHDGNPILEWCISNVVAKIDARDNVFPRKEHFDKKIDGAIAMIMCKDQLMRVDEGSIPGSVRSA